MKLTRKQRKAAALTAAESSAAEPTIKQWLSEVSADAGPAWAPEASGWVPPLPPLQDHVSAADVAPDPVEAEHHSAPPVRDPLTDPDLAFAYSTEHPWLAEALAVEMGMPGWLPTARQSGEWAKRGRRIQPGNLAGPWTRTGSEATSHESLVGEAI